MLNSCIEVSDYNEQYSLCQPLLPSSTLGLTRAKPELNPAAFHLRYTKLIAKALNKGQRRISKKSKVPLRPTSNKNTLKAQECHGWTTHTQRVLVVLNQFDTGRSLVLS